MNVNRTGSVAALAGAGVAILVLACGSGDEPAPDTNAAETFPERPSGASAATPTDAARAGTEEAHLLGMALLSGQGAPKDPARAARWLEQAAHGGYAPAQRELSRLYQRGLGVPEDAAAAARWSRAGAEQGDAPSAHFWSQHLERGRGVAADAAAAERWRLRAAELGSIPALMDLAGRAQKGRGAPRDLVAARVWFDLAAADGVARAARPRDEVSRRLDDAQLREARRRANEWHLANRPRRPDPTTPSGWFERGLARSAGRGLPEDPDAAARWLARAAESGHAGAQRELALLLAEGRGVPRDTAASRTWLERAARAGDAQAAYLVGIRHRDGDGVPKDPIRAWPWLDVARAAGSVRATRELATLEAALSDEQRDAARRFAGELGLPAPWRFEIVDAEGRPSAARVSAADEAGDPLWPVGAPPLRDRLGAGYFYADGGFELPPSVKKARVRVTRGFEHVPVELDAERSDGATRLELDAERSGSPTRLELERVFDMSERGYWSGDGHVHANFGPADTHLIDEDLQLQLRAEDLNFANLLAANVDSDEVFLGERVADADLPASTSRYRLRVSEEFRSEVYGHMSVYGARRLGDPLYTGLAGSRHPWDFPTNHEIASR